MEEQNYFFAPRPKLSLAARRIRGYALLVAIVISLAFVPSYMALFFRATHVRSRVSWQEVFSGFVVLALWQTLLVVPFWRCFLLRRWACEGLCILSWLAAFLLIPAVGLWAPLPFIIVVLFTRIVLDASPDLKSGF